MKRLLLTLVLLSRVFVFSQEGVITLTDDNLGSSFARSILLLEDKDHLLDLEDVINLSNDAFQVPKDDLPNLDFTSSSWWLKFTIKNHSTYSYFILETARPITNVVDFYEVRGTTIENEFKSGDEYPYSEKVIPHNRHLFPMTLYPGTSKSYCIKLMSDGEVVTLPVKISDRLTFFEEDATTQFSLGFYYGLMCLVIIIYFFFFILLRDRAFLYYILYVAAQALLQFSLDGYAF